MGELPPAKGAAIALNTERPDLACGAPRCGLTQVRGSVASCSTERCKERCSKQRSREARDVLELKTVTWKDELSQAQIAQAQHVVDQTLKELLMGKPVRAAVVGVHASNRVAQDGRLYISADGSTLELDLDRDDGVDVRKKRVPLSQISDATFGSGAKAIVLRFTNAMCMEPLELTLASERERLEVMLAVKVLRARRVTTAADSLR